MAQPARQEELLARIGRLEPRIGRDDVLSNATSQAQPLFAQTIALGVTRGSNAPAAPASATQTDGAVSHQHPAEDARDNFMGMDLDYDPDFGPDTEA